jgi:hypothetical protein
MRIDLLDLSFEFREPALPLSLVLFGKDISVDVLELLDLLLNLLSLSINGVSITSDSLKIWTKDGIELLSDNASLLEILEDLSHVDRLLEDLLLAGKVPSLDSLLLLNVSLGSIVLLLPLLEDGVTLLDDLDGNLWLLLEDLGDINLGLNLVTDLVGDGLKDVLHLGLVLVDVSGDGPDQLQTGQEGWESLLDSLELTKVDVLELAVKRVQEFHKVLRLSMLLLEGGVSLVVVVQVVAIWFLVVHLHHIDDFLNLRHVQLLVQGVEGCRPLSPVLSLALG